MAKKRELNELFSQLEILEEKLNILETKVEENKRFSFDQLRDLILRVTRVEDEVKKLQTRINDLHS